ncbi:energy transducer TonB [Flavobacterium johnsoniae]|uniref:TonB C-terminal domain-containing protein n=1 Tax=Flavobacterium johnsoniae (strain ATCC 17061 / DSM 2064 / JCM 8514 / BCRC 14874 / CCUG 350202 / NBRC 14942 / NCIMB 11054 / UW101) TaxID=376686 RepID=A5FNF5_FLAJ1|nr:energy transducer TonB [Flavobacterium johnsoniae]ABQ03260.1 hypothetical protein Fjoh_0223 [Flavobacterium johnsoniae UW101]OXG01317.1 energy transducer TonB [Flavobacterium johnsoniae UW101]WQG79875.1 energy transducer TonB [Flavobacterium johnsoniae UW101]SHL80563.1 outer membrane transport energization protein TonB [Flavobacterium johnsoniae]
MSKLSIYESKWTDLVFENKNKEYGAYQLRQENSKTTVNALFTALLLITAVGSVSMLVNKFSIDNAVDTEPVIYKPLVVTDLNDIVKPKVEEYIAPPAQKQEPASQAPVTSSQLTNPVITHADQAVTEIATNRENTPVVDNTTAGPGTGVNTMPTTGGPGTGEIDTPVVQGPYTPAALDKMPEFPGGIKNFYTYVGKNFTRPELDEERTLRVYVSFVIERDGSMTDILVKNDPGYGLGKEAVRVLKSLKTKWAPGMIDGKAVRTAYNLPITIQTQPE